MRKVVLAVLLSAIITLFCGCAADMGYAPAMSAVPAETLTSPEPDAPELTPELDAPELTPELSQTERNEAKINSLLQRMRNNKASRSAEGFTGGMTVTDAVNKIEAGNIAYASIACKSKLLGYTAVVKYSFSKTNDGTLKLTSMNYYIMPEQQIDFNKQFQELAGKLEAELGKPTYEAPGEHTPGNKYPDCSWDTADYSVILTSEGAFSQSGVLAFIDLVPNGDSETPDIFPQIHGRDIETVYRDITPEPGLEELTGDPYLNYLYYLDEDIYVELFFEAQGNEIKISRVHYDYVLPDTGNEEMGKCFKSLGDSMEEIFGPAAKRDDSTIELTQGDPPQKMIKPHLEIVWPGLKLSVTYVYNDSSNKNYYIDIIFFDEYFTAE